MSARASGSLSASWPPSEPSGQPPFALVSFAAVITTSRQVFDSVRAAERVPLVSDDGAGLVVDDRLHELVLVGEVVVHLRAADFRRHLDVFQGGARHPALMDQGGGLLHYSRPGARSLLGVSLGRSLVSLTMHQSYKDFEFSKSQRPWARVNRSAQSGSSSTTHRMTDLEGKTALVTGSTSGIGKATAIALAARGARVLVVGRNEQRAKDVVAEIEGEVAAAARRSGSLR